MGNSSNKKEKYTQIDPSLVEKDGSPIATIKNRKFSNWSGQIHSTPCATFFPSSKVGICNIVKWAKRNNKCVRTTGYRHTFASFYPDSNDHVLISMISLRDAETLPSRPIPINPSNELVGIEVLKESDDGKKALVKIGAATTNDQFRRWAIKKLKLGEKSWTVPLNVIMVEITFGGSNATMSHGSGINTGTLSDLVRAIEFINCKGELQTVSDKDQLRAAAGCLGLLGTVTSLTLELDAMTYADFNPITRPLCLGVPPLTMDAQSLGVPKSLFEKILQQDLIDATKRFHYECANAYYAEYFWFVFTDQCFINVWNNQESAEKITYEFPSQCQTKLEEYSSYLMEKMSRLFEIIPDQYDTEFLSKFALDSIVQGSEHVHTPLINALHFRRGIQNSKVKNVELMLPIPSTLDGKADWSICQKAWWDCISAIYEYKNKHNKYPCQLALEMRVLGNSNMLLAPENGNRFGTCSIEVVTFATTPEKDWQEFTQYLADKWSSYKDQSGQSLKIRPHWAKQWGHLKIAGVNMIDYLKVINKDNFEEFRKQIKVISEAGGYSVADLKMFSNQTLEGLGLVQ